MIARFMFFYKPGVTSCHGVRALRPWLGHGDTPGCHGVRALRPWLCHGDTPGHLRRPDPEQGHWRSHGDTELSRRPGPEALAGSQRHAESFAVPSPQAGSLAESRRHAELSRRPSPKALAGSQRHVGSFAGIFETYLRRS